MGADRVQRGSSPSWGSASIRKVWGADRVQGETLCRGEAQMFFGMSEITAAIIQGLPVGSQAAYTKGKR